MVKDEETRRWGRERIDRHAQRLSGVVHPEDTYQGSTYEQIYQNMASALGIDLADPNDDVARLVQIGIADLDPSRVL